VCVFPDRAAKVTPLVPMDGGIVPSYPTHLLYERAPTGERLEKIGLSMGGEVKNKGSAWVRLESETACHIVDDGEPGGDGLDLFDASNRELLETAIARLGVDTL
jgi:hypothetical protein